MLKLNKRVCKKCFKRTLTPSAWLFWKGIFKVNWECGKVWCGRNWEDFHMAKDGPPQECPYYLEHVVMGKSHVK